MDQAYAAVGRAIVAAQIFETVLVPIFELHRIHTEPGRLDQTRGFLSAGAFKVPVANLIKILRDRGGIAPDLEARLSTYVEDRHLLVHRWVQENPLPDDQDPATLLPLMEHALKVEREANELARIIVGYVLKYGGSAADPDEFSTKMATMFQAAHKEPK
jgi:hypothetical protein